MLFLFVPWGHLYRFLTSFYGFHLLWASVACVSTHAVDKCPSFCEHMCLLFWAGSPVCFKSLSFEQCPRFSSEMCNSPIFLNLNIELSDGFLGCCFFFFFDRFLVMSRRTSFYFKQVIYFSVLTLRHFAIWIGSNSSQIIRHSYESRQ